MCTHCLLALLAATLLTACHHAERSNPLDPDLTPAVEMLPPVLDEEDGSVYVRWEMYGGQQPFAEYLVLRNVAKSTEIDTLARITDLELTAFTDQLVAPEVIYEYRVEVVNQAGYSTISSPVAIQSYAVEGVHSLHVTADRSTGLIVLAWDAYAGPDFEAYEIWRSSFGVSAELTHRITRSIEAAWTDSAALPGVGYTYWIRTRAGGTSADGPRLEASYELPGIAMQRADLSAATACAELEWERYTGARFASYSVIRHTPGFLDRTVAALTHRDSTRFIDRPLDGNTDYTYRVQVNTTWGADVFTESDALGGAFYARERVENLPRLSTEEVQAVGLALDAADQLFVAITAISTTTARQMQSGVKIRFPGATGYRSFFMSLSDNRPARLSGVHIIVGDGVVYVTVGLEGGDALVGAFGTDGRYLWKSVAPTGGRFPVGLYLEDDGSLMVVDSQAYLYRLSPTGELMTAQGEEDAASEEDPAALQDLRRGLDTQQGLPLRHAVFAPGSGLNGLDQLLLLAPDREGSHVLVRGMISRTTGYIFGGRAQLTDGVGLENGETLNPLAVAYDRSRQRLLVLDAQGRLQAMDARPEDTERRYVTKWGGFGAGDGEFFVSPPTAAAVVADSQGRIYVADGAERVQVFVP